MFYYNENELTNSRYLGIVQLLNSAKTAFYLLHSAIKWQLVAKICKLRVLRGFKTKFETRALHVKLFTLFIGGKMFGLAAEEILVKDDLAPE